MTGKTGTSDLLEQLGVIDEAAQLSSDILAYARDSLLTSLRFVNRPSAQLPAVAVMDRTGCATDGRQAMFTPSFVLSAYRNAPTVIARTYLHMILHCLLGHLRVPPEADALRWSVACDLAVASVMRSLECSAIAFEDSERDELLDAWLPRCDVPIAASYYRLLADEGLGEEDLARMELVIGMDGHDPWLPNDDAAEPDPDADAALQQMQERWEQVARETRMDMEQEQQNVSTDALKDALGPLSAESVGLDELLRAYAAPQEHMAVSQDEFDYIYYTYGLRELGPIALVEPLDYCEQPHLRDFCIAIDTSGSCSGPLVAGFIRKACGALLDSDAFGPGSRIRIIQCDDRIQREDIVRSREDVQAYLADVRLEGLGSTDFRPVFERMDELAESGEVASWEGLLYFTDGKGTFPADTPVFDTAFVFVDEAGEVPGWATRAITYSDELLSDKEL